MTATDEIATIAARREEADSVYQTLRAIILDNVTGTVARRQAEEALIDYRIAMYDYAAAICVRAERGAAAFVRDADSAWAKAIGASPAVEANPPPGPHRVGPCFYCGDLHEIIPTTIGDMMACPQAPNDRIYALSGRQLTAIAISPTSNAAPSTLTGVVSIDLSDVEEP